MRIGIIDADLMDNGTRHPNLALMKIAGYHIELGDEINLIFDTYDCIREYDMVYVSRVFSFTHVPDWVANEPNVIYGGTGFFADGGPSLPNEIEHHKPYYNLYKDYVETMIAAGKDANKYSDYLNYSIGFTTRGCFRKCEFCVNKKYDRVQRHSSVEEFLDENRPMIYLWDDNILAYPKWEEVVNELVKTGKPFQFRQGIDLRLMTDRKAYRFNHVKYHGDFIFAFDHLNDRNLIISKVQLWKKYTNKQPKMYVLSGFESQDANDIANVFERISILMKYGSLPYIMRYEEYRKSKYRGMYIQIARWCNQPQFYKKMSFREFCERNQYYHSNPNTYCASYRAMVEFEEENPEIAKKYFDLKFMNENIYDVSYGFGHRYCNKQECTQCKLIGQCWDEIIQGKTSKEEVISLYYGKKIDAYCLKYKNAECRTELQKAGKYLIKFILKINRNEICQFIKSSDNIEELRKDICIIPNYENDYYINLIESIFQDKITDQLFVKDVVEELGIKKDKEKQLLVESFKVLALIDLVILGKNNKNGKVSLSPLGVAFMKMKASEKTDVFIKNIYRLPVVQRYISTKENDNTFIEILKTLGVGNYREIIDYVRKYK